VQEATVEWDPRYIDGPPPWAFTTAWAINLPALVPALLILIPASMLTGDLASFTSDMLAVASIGAFVPILWYGAGWWIDDRRGRFPPRLFSLPILWQQILAAIALLLSLPALVVGIISLISGLALGVTWRLAEIVASLLGWSGWIFWISLAHVNRLRRLSNSLLNR
jgi:hypothetical protein